MIGLPAAQLRQELMVEAGVADERRSGPISCLQVFDGSDQLLIIEILGVKPALQESSPGDVDANFWFSKEIELGHVRLLLLENGNRALKFTAVEQGLDLAQAVIDRVVGPQAGYLGLRERDRAAVEPAHRRTVAALFPECEGPLDTGAPAGALEDAEVHARLLGEDIVDVLVGVAPDGELLQGFPNRDSVLLDKGIDVGPIVLPQLDGLRVGHHTECGTALWIDIDVEGRVAGGFDVELIWILVEIEGDNGNGQDLAVVFDSEALDIDHEGIRVHRLYSCCSG